MLDASSPLPWPLTLWLVRHGESAGNVARDAAEAAGLSVIDILARDVDVPLSPLGERQSDALGAWFGGRPESEQPTVVLASPYLRAAQTAKRVIDAGGLAKRTGFVYVLDERLREKEFGILNRLTKAGVQAQHPGEFARRAEIGKFYYRPPAGESWCDVILRLRSVMEDIQIQYRGERVLIVAHQVIVLCFRYLLETLDETTLLLIDRDKDVANCSLTTYAREVAADGRASMVLRQYNVVTPLEQAGAPVTQRPDTLVARRS